MGTGPKQRDIGSFFTKAAKPATPDAGAAPKDVSKENKRSSAAGEAKKASGEVRAGSHNGGRALCCRVATRLLALLFRSIRTLDRRRNASRTS
jgi:hypothetical protein